MERRQRSLWRYIFIGGMFIAVVAVYIVLFINLQVSGQDYYTMTSPITYRTRTVKIQAQRGEIFDRNGKKLVGNIFYYDLQLDYGSMPYKSAERNRVILSLLSTIEEHGGAELTEPNYTPIIPTVSNGTLSFEFDTDFFETAKAKTYDKLAEELAIKEGVSADEAAEVFMKRYALTDSDGALTYSPEEASVLFSYRMDLDISDFSSVNPYTFAENVSPELISALRESIPRGYSVYCGYSRTYNYPGYASHLLGRVGKIPSESVETYTELGYPLDATVGTSGVEAAFENYLHGVDGEMTVTEDIYGNTVGTEVTKEPVAGLDVYLTLDIDMQIASEDALGYNIDFVHAEAQRAGHEKSGEDAKAGALSAVDPKTGEVLVLASYPTYDLSTFDEDYALLSEDETAPMLNRALNGTYQPGSTRATSHLMK